MTPLGLVSATLSVSTYFQQVSERLGATVKVGLIFRFRGHCACHETKAGAITHAASGTLAIKTQLLARLELGA